MRTRKKPIGRPRAFDAEVVLDRATALFWAQGFAATSLDHLAQAMNMKRPSIANAFGDKEDLYRRTLARFATGLKEHVRALLGGEPDLERALEKFYAGALEVYFRADPAPGCFVMCTTPAEAVSHPRVRADLKRLIDELDALLAERFESAKRDGQFPARRDAKAAARIIQGVLHSIAIRARGGASKSALRAMSREAVAMVLGR